MNWTGQIQQAYLDESTEHHVSNWLPGVVVARAGGNVQHLKMKTMLITSNRLPGVVKACVGSNVQNLKINNES